MSSAPNMRHDESSIRQVLIIALTVSLVSLFYARHADPESVYSRLQSPRSFLEFPNVSAAAYNACGLFSKANWGLFIRSVTLVTLAHVIH